MKYFWPEALGAPTSHGYDESKKRASQLVSAKWFEQVVGGAHAQRLYGALDARVTGEQDEIGARLLPANPLEQLQSRHPGHRNIRDDEIRSFSAQGFQRRFGVFAELDLSEAAERVSHHLAIEATVVDHHHSCVAHVGHLNRLSLGPAACGPFESGGLATKRPGGAHYAEEPLLSLSLNRPS